LRWLVAMKDYAKWIGYVSFVENFQVGAFFSVNFDNPVMVK
jgi:hypothetical protein